MLTSASLAEDFDKVRSLSSEVEEAGHQLEDSVILIRINLSDVNTQHVDIYPWREDHGKLTMRGEGNSWPGMAGRYGFPVHYIEHFETVVLEGCELPTPSPVERFLVEHRYGPGFRTPLLPVYDTTRYPDIRPQELTDVHLKLFEAVARKESELLAEERRGAGRLVAGVHAWERWTWSGRPRSPAQQRLACLRKEWGVRTGEDPLTDQLLESLAAFEQGVVEQRSPSLGTRANRIARQGQRLALKARRALGHAVSCGGTR